MKKARMNISPFRFILLNLKIFGEVVTTISISFSSAFKKIFVINVNEKISVIWARFVANGFQNLNV